ncbi:hypothetical protein [Streptomyces sp. NPDC001222]|uniref:hypothetical protein n=1 Tax=Streptomyces sp. NPDC001222 TaxID=3364548 RepID=UPI0036C68AA5
MNRSAREPAGRQHETRRGCTGHQRLASEQLLIDFAAAIGADEKATRALLDGRARILAGPPGPLSSYPCAMYEWVEGRRQDDQAAQSWLVEPELDWYDQQLRDAEEAEHRRRVAWVDSLTCEVPSSWQ